MLRLIGLSILGSCLAACTIGDDAPAGESDGAETSSSSGASTTGDEGLLDTSILERLPGLWVAPVQSWTSVGDFPTMNMDIRAASPNVLFSRVDLDSGNALRFAFAIEEHDGMDTLVFRNGGLFLGIERDSRTRLVEADVDEGRYRFCSVAAGCPYIDAVFDFGADDEMTLDVDVMGRPHFIWRARRAETRTVPAPFPNDPAGLPGDAPFPEMPTLIVTLDFPTPTDQEASAWVILTTTDCGLAPGSCTPSRFISGRVPAGSTTLELELPQIHAGDYKAIAVLDRNDNLGATFFPDRGDTVSLPNQSLQVAPSGTTQAELLVMVDI